MSSCITHCSPSAKVNITDLEENDLFFFESDNLALKDNKDYNDLLKSIVILEAQRTKAIKDLDKIIEIKKNALADPIGFVEKLRNNEDLGVPPPQTIATIPDINWAKYNVHIPDEAMNLLNEDYLEKKRLKLIETRKRKHEEKSTHKKPWTAAEQKRLEELLIVYPTEAIEMRRYKKIAQALGNRTVQQVTSRLQKYFMKLYKAGLPIPGRIPKGSENKKRSYIHKHQKLNYYLYKPSTFFPDMDVPVLIPENDDDEDINVQNVMIPESNKENEMKTELEYKKDLLKRVKIEKQVISNFIHIGFKCDFCKEQPIHGSRWHCFDCNQTSIDFCTDCIITQLKSPTCHPFSHRLVPIRDGAEVNFTQAHFDLAETKPSTSTMTETKIKSEPNSENEFSSSDDSSSESSSEEMNYDKDYRSNNFNVGNYNYLDPNFLPE